MDKQIPDFTENFQKNQFKRDLKTIYYQGFQGLEINAAITNPEKPKLRKGCVY